MLSRTVNRFPLSARLTTATVALLLGSLFTNETDAAEELRISFGVYTSDKPTTMYRKFKPVVERLEESLSSALSKRVRIKFRIFRTYEAAREALVEGNVDFVRFGPASFILAKDANPNVSLLAVEEVGGETFFHGVIFSRKESPISNVPDLKGKRFAFGDRTSTIGRFLSQALLVDEGIFASTLADFEYLGRHDKVVSAVAAGQYDAGAAKESTFNKAKDQLKVVAKFKNATKPWVASGRMSTELRIQIRNALLRLQDESVLSALGKSLTGFRTPEQTHYDFVREGMKRARSFEQN